MKKDDLDEYGFNKNYSYDANVEHYDFSQQDKDGMFIDENGSVRYGKPAKKNKKYKNTIKKKYYHSINTPVNKNKKIAFICIAIILGVFIIVIPILSSIIQRISYYAHNYTSSNIENIYNTYDDYPYGTDDDYYSQGDYEDYDYDNGYLSIMGSNKDEIAAQISDVIDYESFNNFTLTYNNPRNFDDYYLDKYNQTVQYCIDNNLDYSLPDSPDLHYIDIYDEENIDYLNIEYYNDEDYDYSYFEILLLQEYDNLASTEPIDTVFADFTSSLGDNSQQICETFKRLTEYCYDNDDYLSDTNFYGTIYNDNYSIYYDYSNEQLVLSVTIENPYYYDTSF